MKKIDFYFDFISPFAYFGFRRLGEFTEKAEISLKPVLFAGLLGHWESKGPAEIPPKRTFTYQYTHWYGTHHGIPFKMPPAHPFNPLPALRLAIAANCQFSAVSRIFDFVWAEGKSFEDAEAVNRLGKDIGIEDVGEATAAPRVKATLKDYTDQAIAAEVFGVPTFMVDNQLCWGVDSIDMVLDYLAGETVFQDAEYKRISSLPAAIHRKI